MKRAWLVIIYLMALVKGAPAQDTGLSGLVQPAPYTAKFTDPGYQVWCGSMIKGNDNRYYLFYSRWPASEPFDHWAISSEVAIAVADHPLGPYKFVKVALPKRDKRYWDADCTHNPTIHKFGSRYYLYYMGNYGNGEFWDHRNHQRVGVAEASSPLGPWKRFDRPVIDVSSHGDDSLMTSNPAICKGRNGFVMVYKCVGNGPPPFGGKVYHKVALAKNPLGPFIKQPRPVFMKDTVKFAAEDPFIWYQDHRYWAIVKDFHGSFTGLPFSLALFESGNALDWKVAANPLVSDHKITWKDSIQVVSRMERPQLYFDGGKPAILFVAVKDNDNNSFNLAIPLKKEELIH